MSSKGRQGLLEMAVPLRQDPSEMAVPLGWGAGLRRDRVVRSVAVPALRQGLPEMAVPLWWVTVSRPRLERGAL
ncbi:MAG: hypothetical protein GY772_04000 [bacterium]|nr:hypothetical protein [bacterium]